MNHDVENFNEATEPNVKQSKIGDIMTGMAIGFTIGAMGPFTVTKSAEIIGQNANHNEVVQTAEPVAQPTKLRKCVIQNAKEDLIEETLIDPETGDTIDFTYPNEPEMTK